MGLFLEAHSENSTIQFSVEVWDAERSEYQAVNCSGVSRLYSVMVSHNSSSPSTIDVIDSKVISALQVEQSVDGILESVGNNVSFMVQYLFEAFIIITGDLSVYNGFNDWG